MSKKLAPGASLGNPSHDALARVISAVGKMGKQIQVMPGADRGAMMDAANDLEEAAQIIGLMPEREIKRPKSRWPEGEGKG